MVATLNVFEAIDACIDYHSENCIFDAGRKAFSYIGKGWGSPRVMYDRLYDGRDNHAYKGKPYEFKLNQFKRALASGALIAKGRKVPITSSSHSTIKAAETVYLEFDAGKNCAMHNGEIVYVELQFMPKEDSSVQTEHNTAGRPSMETQIMAMHEECKTQIKPTMKQAEYVRILQTAFRKKTKDKEVPSPSVINKYLRKHKIFNRK